MANRKELLRQIDVIRECMGEAQNHEFKQMWQRKINLLNSDLLQLQLKLHPIGSSPFKSKGKRRA